MNETYQCDLHPTIEPLKRGQFCTICKAEAEDAIARATTMSNEERIAIFERFITTEYLSIDLSLMGTLLQTLLGRPIEMWEAEERNHRNLIAEIKGQKSRPSFSIASVGFSQS